MGIMWEGRREEGDGKEIGGHRHELYRQDGLSLIGHSGHLVGEPVRGRRQGWEDMYTQQSIHFHSQAAPFRLLLGTLQEGRVLLVPLALQGTCDSITAPPPCNQGR